MSGDLKSEGLTTEVDLTFLFFKSESARFDFLHPEVDPGIQVLHPKVDLGIQVLHPEVDLGIQILQSEVDLGISEAAGNHVEYLFESLNKKLNSKEKKSYLQHGKFLSSLNQLVCLLAPGVG